MQFDIQPELKNQMVFLRPLKTSDFMPLYEVASDPLIWKQHQNSDRYQKENFTRFFQESIASKGALVIIDAQSNRIIGSSRFKMRDETDKVIEIGWSFLGRKYWGGSYNRAFKQLMINHALEFCDWVVFYVNPHNYRSQKAMQKLGATEITNREKPWVLKNIVGLTYAVTKPLID